MQHIVIDARNRQSSTGRYTDRLLQHLQAIDDAVNYRFTVLLKPSDDWRPQAANFQTAISPFPQFSFNPLHELRFAKQVRALKPDLVHFTMTQQPLSYRGRVVTTTHDLTMLRFVRAGKTPLLVFWLKRLGYRLLFQVAHRKSAQVLVPTQFVADDLGDYYPWAKDKIHVTYESSEPPLKIAAEQPRDISQPFIMHVGSPFPHKNIYRLIEAFELLKKDHPDLHLVLAGKKEFYFTELEAWAKQRPSYKDIHFTGFISDAELKWLYNNAEAYLLPSMSEGFGLPGLEAMAHNCPLVSSNATCMPEVYGEAAHYFDPYDVPAMAKAIEEVLTSPQLRKQLVELGKERQTHYSWATMAQQTLDHYQSALNS